MNHPELEWQLKGSCRQADPEIFFVLPKQCADEARLICAHCPVIDECGDWAIATDQQFGIWGGMTRHERLKKARGDNPVLLTVRACPKCTTPFMPKHKKQTYCGAACRKSAESHRRWIRKCANERRHTYGFGSYSPTQTVTETA